MLIRPTWCGQKQDYIVNIEYNSWGNVFFQTLVYFSLVSWHYEQNINFLTFIIQSREIPQPLRISIKHAAIVKHE